MCNQTAYYILFDLVLLMQKYCPLSYSLLIILSVLLSKILREKPYFNQWPILSLLLCTLSWQPNRCYWLIPHSSKEVVPFSNLYTDFQVGLHTAFSFLSLTNGSDKTSPICCLASIKGIFQSHKPRSYVFPGRPWNSSIEWPSV